MAVEDADDRAVFFDTQDFAVAGTYTPPAGAAVAVAAVVDRPTARAALLGTGVATTAWTARLRKDQVAQVVEDATLVVPDGTFKVRRPELDETGQIWSMELRLAS